MKNKILFILAILVLFTLTGNAQQLPDPFDSTTPNASDFLTWYNAIYGALVMFSGFVMKAIGVKDLVPNFVFVVIAAGAVLGAGFIFFGFTSFLPTALTLFTSMGLFDLFKGVQKATSTK